MRGEIRFETTTPAASAGAYLDALAAALKAARPAALSVEGSTLTVRGGMFRLVSNWNLLSGVTVGTVVARPGASEVTVSYDLRVTELIVLCGVLTLLGIPLSFNAFPWVILLWLALVWGAIFKLNCLITEERVARLLRRIGGEVIPPAG
jgi:hypothetical protein